MDLKGAPSLVLTTTIGTQYHAMKEFPTTVTQANCPTVCHFAWESNATAQYGALRSEVMRVKLTWTVPDLFVNSYTYQDFYYDAPVEEAVLTAWQRDAEAGYDEYHDTIPGTGGTLTASSEVAREADEVVIVTVHEIADGLRSTLVQQTEVPWDAAPGEDGRIQDPHPSRHVGLGREGQYSVRMQPRDAQGRWGAAHDNLLVVRHQPAVAVHPAEPAIQAVGGGNPIYATATIEQTAAPDKPASGRPSGSDGRWWSAAGPQERLLVRALDNVAVPAQGSVPIPQLSVGTHTITTRCSTSTAIASACPGRPQCASWSSPTPSPCRPCSWGRPPSSSSGAPPRAVSPTRRATTACSSASSSSRQAAPARAATRPTGRPMRGPLTTQGSAGSCSAPTPPSRASAPRCGAFR